MLSFVFIMQQHLVRGGYDLLTNNWQGWEGSGKPAVMAGLMTLAFGPGSTVGPGQNLGVELLKYAGVSLISDLSPQYNVPISDNVSLSFRPSLVYGSSQVGFGLSGSLNFQDDNFFLSVGGNIMRYGLNFGNEKTEIMGYWAAGYDDDETAIWVSSTYYKSGETSQNIGAIGVRYKDVSFTYQNDYMGKFGLLGDKGDRYRTAAFRATWRDFSFGLNLFTGDPGLKKGDREAEKINGRLTYIMNENCDDPDKYRAGVLYFGYKNYRAGWNNEQVRHLAQNRLAHDIIQRGHSPYFRILDTEPARYYSVGTSNPYTLW